MEVLLILLSVFSGIYLLVAFVAYITGRIDGNWTYDYAGPPIWAWAYNLGYSQVQNPKRPSWADRNYDRYYAKRGDK